MTDETNAHKYHPFPGQALEWCHIEATSYEDERERHQTTDLGNATCLTSTMVQEDGWHWKRGDQVGNDGEVMHRPVLDLDMAAHVIPSTTPGNCHLLIDKPMSWTKYVALLDALVEAGIIEEGYARASQRRGHTSVRLPWVRKGVEQGPHDCIPGSCEWVDGEPLGCPCCPVDRDLHRPLEAAAAGPPLDGTDQGGPF